MIATYHAGNAQPDGDANDCRVGVTSEAEMEGAAFMAYLGRSAEMVATLVYTARSPRACRPFRPGD